MQAAYKVVDIPEHSCYDILKDYIVPILGSSLGIIGAYLVMKSQLSAQLEIEKNKGVKEYLIIKKIFKANISSAIEDLNFVYPVLKSEYEKVEIDKTGFYPTLRDMCPTSIDLIVKSNFESIFKAFLETNDEAEKFNETYKIVIRLSNQIIRINNAIDKYITSYDNLTKQCIAIFRNIYFLIQSYRNKGNVYGQDLKDIFEKFYDLPEGELKNLEHPEKHKEILIKAKECDSLYPVNSETFEFITLCNEALSIIQDHELVLTELNSSLEIYFEEYDSYILKLKNFVA